MNPSLLWMAAALFLWGIGEGMFFFFQPIYLTQLGADPVAIGWILAGAGLAMTISHTPAGYLADRLGRRPLLWASWLLGVVAAFTMALADRLPLFVAGMLLYSFTAFVSAPMNSYITSARGKWTVGRAITLISAVYNAGAVIGPFSGGWIGDHFGLKSVYMVATGIFILSTVLIFFIAAQPRDVHDLSTPVESLFGNRRYLGFLALGFVVIFATYLPQPFTPKFLEEIRHLSLGQIGLLGTLGGAGNAILSIGLGTLNARLGFLLGQGTVWASTLLLWQSHAYGWFALAFFLLGGFRAGRSLFMAQVRPLVHQSQMGLAYGIAETAGSAATFVAPIAAGFMYDKDPALIYPVALVAIMIGLGLSLGLAPHLPNEILQPTIEFPE